MLKDEVWWSNMYKDVKYVIKRCEKCQKTKQSSMFNPTLHAIIPSKKNELLALDLFGPLPRSRGGVTFICVIRDCFTKWVSFYPLKRATTRSILHRLTNDLFPRMGIPESILNDHGTQFTAKRWKETLNSMGVKVIFSSIRRPQSNPSERVMKEIGRLCRTYCNEQHTRWAYELNNFSKFLNSLVHESTGFSPRELQIDASRVSLLPTALQVPHVTEDLEKKLILAKETLHSRAARRALRKSARPYPKLEPGDLVLLRSNPISSVLKQETKKFLLLFEGPYRIKKAISFDTYILVDVKSNKERGSFHVCHLKKYFNPL
ncbi:hypothetical protein HHI36_016535 [Cryptolaemus montrouzieri]|uniref:RNA-directed DNA polymerase n=1 Tax=Cryptolaemus montrouzieri TaxID=559131 RepID=A0ABD2NKF8_9CUCU